MKYKDIPFAIRFKLQMAKFAAYLGLFISILTGVYGVYMFVYSDKLVFIPVTIGTGLGISISFFSNELLKDVVRDANEIINGDIE